MNFETTDQTKPSEKESVRKQQAVPSFLTGG